MTGESQSPTFVDAHCHVDLFPSPRSIVEEATRGRIHTIAVTNAPFVFDHTRKLAQGNSYIHAAVGLHPELVHSHGSQVAQMWPLLEHTRFVGEIGLDYVTTDQALRQRQRRIFESIVQRCATYGDKVLTIHSRRSASDVIAVIGKDFPGTAILHWFSGTKRELERAIANGCHFSVNPSMLTSASGRLIISMIPPQRLLTESDAPFVKQSGITVTPRCVCDVIDAIAEMWHQDKTDVAAIVSENFRRIVTGRDSDSSPH